MSKRFRYCKNLRKRIGNRVKFTFRLYKIGIHLGQKQEKSDRKNYLKAKSVLCQGRKSVVIGNTLYCWEKDKKSIAALTPDFDMTRRVFEMIKKEEEVCR